MGLNRKPRKFVGLLADFRYKVYLETGQPPKEIYLSKRELFWLRYEMAEWVYPLPKTIVGNSIFGMKIMKNEICHDGVFLKNDDDEWIWA